MDASLYSPSAPQRRYQAKFRGLCRVQTAVNPGKRLRIRILLGAQLGQCLPNR